MKKNKRKHIYSNDTYLILILKKGDFYISSGISVICIALIRRTLKKLVRKRGYVAVTTNLGNYEK